MGSKSFSIPKNFVSFIKDHANNYNFLETGTFKGGTVDVVRNIVNSVHTCEPAEKYYNFSKDRFSAYSNVEVYNEDSLSFLKRFTSLSNKIYWIDSHFKGGDTFGSENPCPLIDELEIILPTFSESDILLIDDSRLFTMPNISVDHKKWPDLVSIVNVLKRFNCKLYIDSDVLIVGKEKSDIVDKFLYYVQKNNTSVKKGFFNRLF